MYISVLKINLCFINFSADRFSIYENSQISFGHEQHKMHLV